jgi:hypothetical protein
MLATSAVTAQAADSGFYLGAAVTQSQIDHIASALNLKDNRFKIIAGLRPIDRFAVELDYMDLGRDSAGTGLASVQADVKAAAAYAVGFLPVPFGDVYVKLGLARWDLSGSSAGLAGAFRLDRTGTELAYGAGVQARLGSAAVRLEYEGFDIKDTGGLKLYSLGFTWTFL